MIEVTAKEEVPVQIPGILAFANRGIGNACTTGFGDRLETDCFICNRSSISDLCVAIYNAIILYTKVEGRS